MENSFLCQAHAQQRKADFLLSKKKFSECIDCHTNAIVLLTKTIKLTNNEKALESLKLQKLYHEKQIRMVEIKQEQNNNPPSNDNKKLEFIVNSNENIDDGMDALQSAIFKNISVQDSLIIRLEKGRLFDSFSASSENDEKSIDQVDTTKVVGVKHPKDDNTTIEELKILNGQLHELVVNLVNQLADKNDEIEKLKQRISQLELKE